MEHALSINGVNEKMQQKGGSAHMRGVGPQSATNDNNGYLIKSAQNSVNKQHAHHHQAFPGKMHS